jgi:osmoprotectant transport system permease protein
VTVLLASRNPIIRWSYLIEQWDRIQRALLEHIALTMLAVGAGFVVSSLLAAIALRYRWSVGPITLFAAFLYTIPSVAFYGVLRTTGLGTSIYTVLIPLTAFTILVLVTSILDGFRAVPAPVREAADAMGLTPFRRVVTVEVPVAIPYVINGLRIATVTTVGLVAVAAIVGRGGLGSLILDGIRRTFWTPLTIGASLSILLALAFDMLYVLLGRWLTPWSRVRPP